MTAWTLSAEYRDSLLLCALSIIFFCIFSIDTPVNGDTYAYSRCVTSFRGPVIHLGYFAIGHAFYTMLKGVGCTPIQALGYMSAFFGGISVAIMYLFVRKLTGDRFLGFLAALILMFSGAFWLFSEHGEVYVPQLCFVLLSALLIIRRMFFMASLCFLIAVSITPTSCLALPFLLYVLWMYESGVRQLMSFVWPIAVVFAALSVAEYSRVMAVARWAIHSPLVFFDSFSLSALAGKIVRDLAYVYGKSFNFFFFAAIYGFLRLYKLDRKQWLMMVAICLPFSMYILNLGLLSGDHLIITFVAVAFLAAYGVGDVLGLLKIPARGGYVFMVLPVFVYSWLSFQLFIGPERRNARELNRVVQDLSVIIPSKGILIADYNFGMAFWALTQKEDNFFLFTGRPTKFLQEQSASKDRGLERLQTRFWINAPHFPAFITENTEAQRLISDRQIYFADLLPWPGRLVRIILPKEVLDAREKKRCLVHRLKNYLQRNLGYRAEITHAIDSPLVPVYTVRFLP